MLQLQYGHVTVIVGIDKQAAISRYLDRQRHWVTGCRRRVLQETILSSGLLCRNTPAFIKENYNKVNIKVSIDLELISLSLNTCVHHALSMVT